MVCLLSAGSGSVTSLIIYLLFTNVTISPHNAVFKFIYAQEQSAIWTERFQSFTPSFPMVVQRFAM